MSRISDTHDEVQPARPFQFTGRIRSFYHAFCGILRMVRCQHNAWVHAFATFAVLFAAFFFRISGPDWCWIILAISMVWTAEALNTAFEFLADAASPEFHPLVRNAKDVAAGAVLITAIAAVIIGCIVFRPYVESFVSSHQ
jgi:diacylglycerol kinase (ATP)